MAVRSLFACLAAAGLLLLAACGRESDGTRKLPERTAPPPALAPAAKANDENIARWRAELARWGGAGGWAAWQESLAPFQKDARKLLADRPAAMKGIVGRDGFLFLRTAIDYLLGGDITQQPSAERNPFPVVKAYAEALEARGMHLLFCPIPVKASVYPEKVSKDAPADRHVNPFQRKLLLELAEAGVESIDLLPVFLKAKAEKSDLLYQPQDTHWTHRALRLSARALAERIKQEPWYAETVRVPVQYTLKEVAFTREGDITRILPEEVALEYEPAELTAQQVVRPDGSFYKDDKTSPVLLLGDSYAGVLHYEDCRHAGISALLAYELGTPVDLIVGQGMGPKVWKKLRRSHSGRSLGSKKVVIWIMSARDLYNYRDPWEVVPLPE